MSGWRAVVSTLTVQVLLLLLVSYLGPVHPVGDSVAAFRLQIAAVVAIGAVVLWGAGARAAGLAAATLALFAGAPILYGFSALSAGNPGPYVFYQKNLFRKELSRTRLTKDILASDPDFVTLQEITAHDLRYMKRLFDAYDAKLICSADSVVKVGLLSRFPLVPGTETCLVDERLAGAKVQLPDGSTSWLISLHLGWPYPAGQHAEAMIIADWISRLEGPVMIGGDFNMVPWGSSVKMISQAARTERAGPFFGTFPVSGRFVPLPIDHILLPRGTDSRAEARPAVGSDHLGIIARFGL